MLDKNEILNMKKELPDEKEFIWIYFLIYRDQIVYIGKTNSGYNRILQHIRKGDKLFDSYSYVTVPIEDADDLEFQYLNKFKPKLNKYGKNGHPWKF